MMMREGIKITVCTGKWFINSPSFFLSLYQIIKNVIDVSIPHLRFLFRSAYCKFFEILHELCAMNEDKGEPMLPDCWRLNLPLKQKYVDVIFFHLWARDLGKDCGLRKELQNINCGVGTFVKCYSTSKLIKRLLSSKCNCEMLSIKSFQFT